MKIITPLLLASVSQIVMANSIHDNGDNVVWTAIFEQQTPISSKVNTEYCISHSPNIISTTINQITSESGTTALNKINIRYLTYSSKTSDGLYFNTVNGIISGKNLKGQKWQSPIKLYEQTLDEIGKTYTVWSTPYCKGTFIGYPTIVKPAL